MHITTSLGTKLEDLGSFFRVINPLEGSSAFQKCLSRKDYSDLKSKTGWFSNKGQIYNLQNFPISPLGQIFKYCIDDV